MKKRSQSWLTPNNATMSSFIQMFTVNEEDDSYPINDDNMEINLAEDDMQMDSIEEQIIEEADKKDIIEIFTENIRHEIKNIPIIANLDLDEKDDPGELSDDKDKSIDGNTCSASLTNTKQANTPDGGYRIRVLLVAVRVLPIIFYSIEEGTKVSWGHSALLERYFMW